MKHSLPPLDSLKAFEAAARHLSFSIAANELCITKGAVSYQIRKLEEEIQCTLFKRSTRQVYLTEAGQSLFQTTKQAFKEFENTFTKLLEVKQQTSVSIATTTYVAARWLSSRISRFTTEFPDINIVFRHSINKAEFKFQDTDLAILWEPCSGNLNKHRIAEIPMSMFPVISPQVLETNNINTKNKISIKKILEKPFNEIPLLCEDRELDTWQEWFEKNRSNGMNTKLTNPRRIISDANVRVQAAIDGQGFILADDLMLNEIKNGLLKVPFTEKLAGYGYSFYASSTRNYADKATILKRWIIENI